MRDLEMQEITHLLRAEQTAYLAVVDGDTPYVSPLSYVYSDGEFVFRTKEGRRLDALRQNPRVGIAVTATGDRSSDWMTVFVTGTAEILSDAEATGRYVGQIIAKYRAAYGVLAELPDWMSDPEAHVVRVVCDEPTGRAAGHTKPGRF